MDRNHRRDRITINEEGNLVPETSFFRTLLERFRQVRSVRL
jgi:hypothetical protein